jgi:hypothetical protein
LNVNIYQSTDARGQQLLAELGRIGILEINERGAEECFDDSLLSAHLCLLLSANLYLRPSACHSRHLSSISSNSRHQVVSVS